MKKLLIALTLLAVLTLSASAADYEFTTAGDTDYYGSTDYEGYYDSSYNYGGMNEIDFDIPEIQYGLAQEFLETSLYNPYLSNSVQYGLSYSGGSQTGGSSVSYTLETGTFTVDYGGEPIPVEYTPEVTLADMLRDDGSIGTVTISSVGMEVKVYEGATTESMAKGAGHYETTSLWDGNVGLFGRMSRIMNSFYKAVEKASDNNLAGIGALPEGIENNAVLFDLLYALPWTCDKPYTINSWLQHYVSSRYGVTETSDSVAYRALYRAWQRLANGIYNCPNKNQQGTTESVFMMRPAKRPGTVSTWAGSSWYWNIDDLRTAAYEFLSVADKLKDNDNYRYDLVDIMRQTLADDGKETLDRLSITTDVDERFRLQQKFLCMILDQDSLVGTRKELRLRTWTEMARHLGHTQAEKRRYEQNARMLLTTWGGESQCNGGGLHDYGNREWNGLLSAYYYPRWKAFFDNSCQSQDWFSYYEWPFVTGATDKANVNSLSTGAPYAFGSFSSAAVGDEVEQAKKVFHKYFRDFKPLR